MPHYSIRAMNQKPGYDWSFDEVCVVTGTLRQAEVEALKRCKNTAHYVCLLTEKSTAWAGATEVDRA